MTEAREVEPRSNNPMGYSYRCRIEEYTTRLWRHQRWAFIVERHFMSNWDWFRTFRGFHTDVDARVAARQWLDNLEKEPEKEEYIT